MIRFRSTWVARALVLAVCTCTAACVHARTAPPVTHVESIAAAAEQASGSVRTPVPGIESVRPLLALNLRASGIDDPVELQKYENAFVARLSEPLARIGRSRSEYRRARRLHDMLHAKFLRRYSATADGLDAVLDRGEYNCVSASLLYGIAARALGLDPEVVEGPRHVFIRLTIDDDRVDIECTSPRGFDVLRDLEAFRTFVLAYKYATPEELERYGAAAVYEDFHQFGRPVTLDRATAFLWHNTGERALDRGNGPKAAACFQEEFRLYPDLVYRSERIGIFLARAFRSEYEKGLFESAYRIAEIEREIFPDRTTTRDRFLAAASKRVEGVCDAGDPAAAEAILSEATSSATSSDDRARLERETCPRIAAAAVRAGDWEIARRMAERFAVAEPDEVEASRFIAWVERRSLEGSSLPLEEVCSDPRREHLTIDSGLYGTSPKPRR